jgi:hypothetical protein
MSEDVPDDPGQSEGTWDEGLAHHRTELSWGRSGLALLVVAALLVRRVLTLPPFASAVVCLAVALGVLLWLVGMRTSRQLVGMDDPHGLEGGHAFALITTGTLVLGLAALFLGAFYPV